MGQEYWPFFKFINKFEACQTIFLFLIEKIGFGKPQKIY